MTRLNLVLLLAIVASALYLVNVQYESRLLFTKLDKLNAEARRLQSEHEKLQVERQAQATPLRVEKLAKDQLQMRTSTPAISHYVTYGALAASSSAKAVEGSAR